MYDTGDIPPFRMDYRNPYYTGGNLPTPTDMALERLAAAMDRLAAALEARPKPRASKKRGG